MRIQQKLLESEEGSERVRKALERKEAGRQPREAAAIPAAEAGEEPVLEGRPQPDAEMAAEEAAGAPLERIAPRELERREEEREPKRRRGQDKKNEKKGEKKREAEVEVEELHDQEARTVSEGASSSSAQAPMAVETPPVPDASSGSQEGTNPALDISSLTECLCSVVRRAEIFSPPRVAAQAQLVGMRPGFSIDLKTGRSDGGHWDLSKDSHVKDLIWISSKWKNQSS